MRKHLFLFLVVIFGLLIPEKGASQIDSLIGKYKLSELNGINYDGFVLLPDSKAVLLKIYTKKFLFNHELPKDSLTLFFNPGLVKIKEFPVEISLLQPIAVKWEMKEGKLIIQDQDLKAVFRRFKTSFVTEESQIVDFSNPDHLPMYYQIEKWGSKGQILSKLKVWTYNKDHIPSNFDLYEYTEEIPQTIILRTADSSFLDTVRFEFGKGSQEIILESKSLKPKNNLFSNYELNRSSLTGYFYNTQHGYEYTYYHPKEITEVYEGSKFLLKREAWYEEGERSGKWLYYDKKGRLVKTEIYKKGELKKTIEN
ncbi:MAG: hypothetical protein KDC84_09995 [Crocinitomicaceae bacterium]|nr:hypothetical protein [Crocinitomicaceae bacterium]